MADGRIYVLEHKSGAKRLIRADNRTQAIGFVARDEFACDVASQDELVELVARNIKVERAKNGGADDSD